MANDIELICKYPDCGSKRVTLDRERYETMTRSWSTASRPKQKLVVEYTCNECGRSSTFERAGG